MKTNLILSLLLTLPSLAQAAQENRGLPDGNDDVYQCDILRGEDGGEVLGGPSYSVVLGQHETILRVTSGVLPGRTRTSHDVPMQFDQATREGDEYRADEIVVVVKALNHAGQADRHVKIKVGSGSREETAQCKLENN